jgi:hypothetical protein
MSKGEYRGVHHSADTHWGAHPVGYIVYFLCRIIGLEGSMGTAMTRRRSGPWPDSADHAMSDIFPLLIRGLGSRDSG